MSKLAAAIAEAKPRRNGGKCGLCKIMDGLDDIDRKAVENLLADDSWYGEHIAEFLTEHGFPIRGHAVMYHRNKKCDRGRTR